MATAKTKLSKAIVATGGKQYLVSVGSMISVEKLDVEVGSKITLDSVVLASGEDNQVLSLEDLKNVAVTAEVLEQKKGKKIRVSTFKSKKRQQRTLGHRQRLTVLKVTDIVA